MIDFDKAECLDNTNAEEFGLCDNDDKTPAFISHDKQIEKWIATVVNKNNIDVTFIALDNCIDVFRPNGEMDNRCDCLLQYPDNIVFVELKSKRANWIQEGLGQIESTLINIADNVGYAAIKKKRAFVANRKHPHFHVLDQAQRQYFFSQYRVRINVQAEINI